MKKIKPLFDRKKYGGVFLSIDPGAEMGWATWSMHGPLKLLHAGECMGEGSTWQDRAHSSVDKLTQSLLYVDDRPGVIVIEWPAFWNNAFGQGVAARGDLLKLVYNVGLLAESFSSSVIPLPLLLPVGTWKGQMSKEVVKRRCMARINKYKLLLTSPNGEDRLDGELTGHAWDAVGIGLYAQGIALCD